MLQLTMKKWATALAMVINLILAKPTLGQSCGANPREFEGYLELYYNSSQAGVVVTDEDTENLATATWDFFLDFFQTEYGIQEVESVTGTVKSSGFLL